MSIVTDALVLKVTDTGESDRLLYLLTADYGVIRAFANRASKSKSNMQAASQALCYGEFNIYSGRDTYTVNSAVVKEVFFDLRKDIRLLALGQYFCSLAYELIPEGEPAPDSLRVILNSLSFLQSGRRSPEFLKAVTELKLISLAGYAPDLSGCAVCGESPAGEVLFSTSQGRFTCKTCSKYGRVISPGVLTAMKHITMSELGRIYSFRLSEQDEKLLEKISEEYLLARTGKTYKALEFYKSVSI